jgi:hypothetical protein
MWTQDAFIQKRILGTTIPKLTNAEMIILMSLFTSMPRAHDENLVMAIPDDVGEITDFFTYANDYRALFMRDKDDKRNFVERYKPFGRGETPITVRMYGKGKGKAMLNTNS